MITAMADMAKTPDQINKEMQPFDAAPKLENIAEYPYGLCITLDDDGLAKLGLDGSCEPGDGLNVIAYAKVTNASATEKADGSVCRRVELQITHMALGPDHYGQDEAAAEGEAA